MAMLKLFPTGEFPIEKMNKNGIYFRYNKSLIFIPTSDLIALNSCISCKHFNFENKKENTCKAFPNRIPDTIFLGKNDHKKPYPNDNGIQFEPIK